MGNPRSNAESRGLPPGAAKSVGWQSGALGRGAASDEEEEEDSWQGPKQETALFLDSEAIKAKLRENLCKPEYNVSDFYHKTGWCQLVARSSYFEKVTLSVIAFNALWIAIDTDMNGAAVTLDAQPVFQVAEHGFCIYFTWEWTMRFLAFRRKRDGLRDGWFVFDSILVFMMVAETWVMSIVLLALGDASAGGSGGGNTSTLRLLRLLRLSRMARMAKLLRSCPELLILIKGMAAAMRSVLITLLLLLLFIYVYSIMFRQLTDGSGAGLHYFPSMWVAMHTLWIDGTLLDGPGSVVAMLMEESVIFALLFYSFVLLAAFTVLNMLIGVVCEVVSAVAASEKEQNMRSAVAEGFQAIIRNGGVDTDGDGMISKEEFMQILDCPDAVKLLLRIDVDPYAFVDLADFLFEEEDAQEEKPMTLPGFIETVLSLRGSNRATVKDVVDLRKFIKTQFSSAENKNHVRESEYTRSLQTQPCRESTCRQMVSMDPPLAGQCSSSLSRGPSSATVGISSGLNCSLPSPILGACEQGQLWMQAAEIEGVLAAAKLKLDQFVNVIPSPPTTPSSCGISDSHATGTADIFQWNFHGDGSSRFTPPMTQRHHMSRSNSRALTEATGATTSAELRPLALSGMVRGAFRGCSDETGCDTSRGPKAASGGGSHCPRSHSRTRSAPPCVDPASLPSRLAELRLHFQEMGQSLKFKVEELRSIQEMMM